MQNDIVDSASTPSVSGANTKESGLDRALAGWKRCGLTWAQTHTELVRYAKNVEQQRDEMAGVLQHCIELLDETYSMTNLDGEIHKGSVLSNVGEVLSILKVAIRTEQ